MRHSLIRLFRLLHIDARWFVPKPNPTVFRITKDIHNLLQGVAGPEVDFTQAQQKTYEQWLESNCEHLNWTSDVFTNSDVIILDDPQLLGCVKHIRKSWHGRGKQIVIYRSHIQIRTDLIKDPSKPQYRLWNYLMSHIRQCDLFISHPLSLQSVPSDIPTSKVVFMPAFADPLDGLNKSMPTDQVFHYLSQFNHHCLLQTGNTQGLQYPHRQFIVQLSRFDPSKGQLDALECFRMLRERLDSTVPLSRLPQLVLAGHGSVDDPDGTVVFQQLMERLSDERFDRVRQDVLIARLPPEDRILNALLRCARVALQLSCQEGITIDDHDLFSFE